MVEEQEPKKIWEILKEKEEAGEFQSFPKTPMADDVTIVYQPEGLAVYINEVEIPGVWGATFGMSPDDLTREVNLTVIARQVRVSLQGY